MRGIDAPLPASSDKSLLPSGYGSQQEVTTKRSSYRSSAPSGERNVYAGKKEILHIGKVSEPPVARDRVRDGHRHRQLLALLMSRLQVFINSAWSFPLWPVPNGLPAHRTGGVPVPTLTVCRQ